MTVPSRKPTRHHHRFAGSLVGAFKPLMALAVMTMLSASCGGEAGLGYDVQVLNQPLPDLERDRVRECLAINRELARLQPRRMLSIKQVQAEPANDSGRDVAEKLAILQQRAGNIGCFARRPAKAPIRVVPLVMDTTTECAEGAAARGSRSACRK